MKTKKILAAMAFLGMVITPSLLNSQNAQILTISTFHRNPNADAAPGEWRATEKEYFDKIVKKNEYIVGANVLVHYFTDDASEILFIAAYKSWEDIEKAEERNNELAKQAWPDSVKRAAFFKKQNSFYARKHSDEILTIMPFVKPLPVDTNQYVYYFRTMHWKQNEDAKPGDFRNSMNELLDNVIKKNDLVKFFGMARHMWGADSRLVLQVAAFNSLSDIEKSFEKQNELVKEHWPDESKRKAFFDDFDKFFAPWHGDAVYRNVPGLRK